MTHGEPPSADPDRFAELFRQIAPAVLAWANVQIRPVLRRRLDPEDLLQEVGCRAFESFASFDEARGSFRAFAFGIARHVLHDAFRRVAADPVGHGLLTTGHMAAIADVATSISRAVARDQAVAELLRHADGLDEEDRRLFLYRGLEGLPHQEVARILGVSPEAVMKRWQRLREQIGGEERIGDYIAQ